MDLEIPERIFLVLCSLLLLGFLGAVLYNCSTSLVSFVKRLIPRSKKPQHYQRVRKVEKLRNKYPDAYKEWYPDDTITRLMSDADLDKRINRPRKEWRNKQHVLDEERTRYNQRMTKVNEICTKYPLAYKDILGKKLIDPESLSKVKAVLDAPLVRLSSPAGIASKQRKQNSDREYVPNHYSLSEKEISLLLNTPESKLAEIETRDYHFIDNKYHEICKLYPNGISSFRIKNPTIAKELTSFLFEQDIVVHESLIKEYEHYYNECQILEIWTKKQESFINSLTDLKVVENSNCGYSFYSVPISGIDLWGDKKEYHFQSLFLYRQYICRDTSIDYSLIKNRICQPTQIIFVDPYIKELASIIQSIPNVAILIQSNEFEEDNDFYFDYFNNSRILGDIPVLRLYDYLEDENYNYERVLIFQHAATPIQAEHNCERILFSKKNIKPLVASVSIFRILSSQEVKEMIVEEEERIKKEREQREQEVEKKRLFDISHTNKMNWEDIREYLRWRGVSCLYHFTDRSNLRSIKEHGGLYSWKYCEERGISIPRAGGSDLGRKLDEMYNLEDYVRLSFCDDHPMAYRLKQEGYNLVLLKIHVRVAWLHDTLFSDMNATDSAHHHGGTIDDLKLIDIKATKEHFVSQDSPIFKKHQAEVLVKTFIPIEYITIPGSASNNRILDSLSLSPSLPHKDTWIEKERRSFTTQEIEAVESSIIVGSNHGRSIRFVMKNGGITYLPLTSSSTLYVGESVDLNTAKLITLGKRGEGDIYHVEAKRKEPNEE